MERQSKVNSAQTRRNNCLNAIALALLDIDTNSNRAISNFKILALKNREDRCSTKALAQCI